MPALYIPRCEKACAVCAVKDWVENRYPAYLFARADNDISKEAMFYAADDTEEHDKETRHKFLTKDGVLCVGPAEKINDLLSVENYIKDWPKIPKEELHASSIQHPDYPEMRWLLHSRRVPTKESVDSAVLPRADDAGASLPRCAGIGDGSATVWMCWDCAQALCVTNPVMPKFALANWMWLGRVHLLFRGLELGMRLLLGLGRPMIHQIFLGRGPRDEVHQGLTGNTMLIAQPTADAQQVVPDPANALSNVTLMFCKSVDDVRKAHTLVVDGRKYKTCMDIRKQVCPAFDGVRIDSDALARELPQDGVPPAFVAHAVLPIL